VLKGFKEFLLRGNVVDLAVAVVIGTAFTKLVTQFTTSFINPVIAVVMGGGTTGGTVKLDRDNRLLVGDFFNEVITFVITAAVVYFIFVVPIKRLMAATRKKEAAAPAAPPAPPEDVVLLKEIRDLLAEKKL
jgi:large conductance mechanosensitive channel